MLEGSGSAERGSIAVSGRSLPTLGDKGSVVEETHTFTLTLQSWAFSLKVPGGTSAA